MSDRRTVGVNLLWLVPGQVGGSEQSTAATLRGLVDLAPRDLELRLFALPAFADAHPDLVAAAPTERAPIDGSSRPRRVLAEATWLHRRTRGLDLVHHAGGTVPARRSAPAVLTLHDLQPLEAQATHARAKRAYLARAVPLAVRAARRIAVPSEFVRRTVLERFGLAPEVVRAIPHAVPVRPPPTARAVLEERHRIDGPVVLYPAITYPHKHHLVLARAFARVLDSHPDALLVLPGGVGSSEGELRSLLDAEPRLRSRVRRLGRVPDADVAGLLGLAAVVAVPSRYEGFGLPALEAMAAGVPVVVADATALPEVVGDAGRLVPVGDVRAWAEALGSLLGDATERARLAAAGRERAAAYTPEANATGFAALYREALEGEVTRTA